MLASLPLPPWPQVVLAMMYRSYSFLLSLFGSTGVECFTIQRGYDQPPITACNGSCSVADINVINEQKSISVGLGDAAYFYVWWIFALNGVFASLLFLLATYISDSIVGGLMSLALFLYNHGEVSFHIFFFNLSWECFIYPECRQLELCGRLRWERALRCHFSCYRCWSMSLYWGTNSTFNWH